MLIGIADFSRSPYLVGNETVQQLWQVLQALPLIRQLAGPRHNLPAQPTSAENKDASAEAGRC